METWHFFKFSDKDEYKSDVSFSDKGECKHDRLFSDKGEYKHGSLFSNIDVCKRFRDYFRKKTNVNITVHFHNIM